jgi:TolA-binding protein
MRIILVFALLLAGSGVATSASAQQQAGLDGRVDRLEREMRAVQRKVFPGGGGATVDPQITAPEISQVPGTPSGGALADMTARVSALETGVRSVTGQVEQATYRVRQLEEAFEAYRRATDARLKLLENGVAGVSAAPADAPTGTARDSIDPAASGATTRPTTPRAATPRPSTASASADPARTSAAQLVERPSTGDPAEDGYTYGYRLWQANLYAEAAAELKTVADKYPRHRRASFAQNLLGRTYLDDGKPSLASLAFYDSYKKFPDGERAPDSLFYLAKALVVLKKPNADICKVYGELTEVYGSKISASMRADVEKGRVAQKCK